MNLPGVTRSTLRDEGDGKHFLGSPLQLVKGGRILRFFFSFFFGGVVVNFYVVCTYYYY